MTTRVVLKQLKSYERLLTIFKAAPLIVPTEERRVLSTTRMWRAGSLNNCFCVEVLSASGRASNANAGQGYDISGGVAAINICLGWVTRNHNTFGFVLL